MTGIEYMWLVWGIFVVAAIALHLYRERLTANEDDQVILDDSFDNVKKEQAEMVEKVKKIEPAAKVIKWLAAAMTVVVIGYYIAYVVKTLLL
jgi:hypothetical protein